MSKLTADQLEEYCHRLKRECIKTELKKERKNTFKLDNIKELIDWKNVRTGMTTDFLEPEPTSSLSIVSAPIPRDSQEHKLVTDLLACFLGASSDCIQPEPLSPRNGERHFRISSDLDPKMFDLTQKCVILAKYYSRLCRFIEDNRFLCVGQVNQALISAMQSTLNEYTIFIKELDKIHREKPLCLPELWFHIQYVIQILKLMHDVFSDIVKYDVRGGATLTHLHRQTSSLVEPHSHRALLKYFIKTAAKPYLESVEQWIFNGIIFDPFDEFMIVEKDTNAPGFWEKRYQLRKYNIPEFLSPVANKILKSGAYLNVVKESVSHEKVINLAPIEPIKYSWNCSKYLDVIHRAYTHSSSYLLSHMMEEYQLMDRFMFMKRYFLVQQGDFVVQVLDTCDSELSKPLSEVIPSRLETLVDMAVKGIEGSVRDDLKILLQPQDLSHQISKILSPSLHDDHGRQEVCSSTSLTGYESFTLTMKCQWPVSLVFDPRSISCYQMLFRLLFYCKYIERLLSKVWMLDQRLRKLPTLQIRQYSTAFALRHKMIYFIQSMQNYMMEEVIEPNWIEFQHQLKEVTSSNSAASSRYDLSNKVPSIDDLMDVHKNFLDKCLNDCLITNATLFPLFVSLLAVCKQFVTFIIHFDEQNGDIVISDIATFSSTISSLDKRFQENYVLFLKTLTESARLDDGGTKIFEILNRANFNHYFTKIMENLEDSHQQ